MTTHCLDGLLSKTGAVSIVVVNVAVSIPRLLYGELNSSKQQQKIFY